VFSGRTFYVVIANGRTPDRVGNLDAAGRGQLRVRRRTVDVRPPLEVAKSWRIFLGLTASSPVLRPDLHFHPLRRS
jgi:hypothetical protein